MIINQKGIDLIKEFEGFRSEPYLCPAGVPTIGYGLTIYPDTQKKVTMKDQAVSETKAEYLLKLYLEPLCKQVDTLCIDRINDNQFSALVSFAYNLGVYALKVSTLLKRVNSDPNDSSITTQFNKWVFANGKKLPGLVRRRKAEAELYFTPV